MLFNSTRRYYLDEADTISFDHKQLKIDFNELREVYPSNLVKLIELMTKVNPQERMGLNNARLYIKSVR